MNMAADILDDLVNTDELMDQLFIFLQKRMPDACFQIISYDQRVISTEAAPDLTVDTISNLAGMVEDEKGFIDLPLKEGVRAHAVYINELKAVLVISSVIQTLSVNSPHADFVLLLIELFFTQIALDNKKEDLKVQKTQFNREHYTLRKRYCMIQDEAHRLQLDYARNLNDEIDIRTKEIRTTNERLQYEIEERKRMVAIANKLALKANMANKSKSEFLSKMSHEFRTPLNSIIGFSDMLTETNLDTEQTEYLDFIKTSSHFLLGLVNDVLNLSKIESGRQNIESIEFDLVEMICEVEDITIFKRLEKGIGLKKFIDPKLNCSVIGDRFRLQQVLVNLMGNAIKFMTRGDINISIELEGESESHIQVRFLLEDEGPGISEDEIDKIFLPFVQVDSSNTRKFGGTGLGLAISDELVKLMGGERIFLRSELGSGSTFFFSIKFPKGSGFGGVTEELCVDEMDKRSGRYQVLLVEDVFQNRRLITASLARRGYTIVVAENGRQAVDIVQREKIDIVLMDVQMPVMDGLEATRRIRIKNKTIPIIAMTAGALECDKEKCLEAGMDDYISKPVDIKKLDQKIEGVIERKRVLNGNYDDGKSGCAVADSELARESIVKDIFVSSAVLDVEEAIQRLDNNEELYRDILFEFFLGSDDIISKIRDAFDNGDTASVGRLAHRLKGTAGSISANVLSHSAFELEEATRQRTLDGVDRLIGDIENNLNQVLALVRIVIGDSREKPVKERDDETRHNRPCTPPPHGRLNDISSMFWDLEKCLQACDPVGSNAIMASIKKRVYGSVLYDEIVSMEGMVNDFNFAEVSQKMESLIIRDIEALSILIPTI